MINYRKDPRQRSKKVPENEEDHSKDGRTGGREVRERQRSEQSGEKRPTTGTDGNKLRKYPYFGVTSNPASPLHKENQSKNNRKCWCRLLV